jgi:RHS repeat-associated protein
VAYTLAPSQTWNSATGAQTNYTYGYSTTTGWSITATTTNAAPNTGSHYTTTVLDGLGRTASVQAGGSTLLSEVDTLYAPCACSPVGKMYKRSQPYASGTPVYTTYTYDALGRTVNVLLPDGASHTAYTYQGNFTTITDPNNNWKQYASDAFGNLVTVLEPDPTVNPVVGPPNPPPSYPVTGAPSGMLLTTYTYDQLNHLTQVAMPRSTIHGMKTQKRTFVYASTSYYPNTNLPALWLTSATNPENGTVSYTYNADGTLATKTDANGNPETYTYDAYQRLTAIPDRQQTFTYDTCPTVNNLVGCVSAAGYLMQATFGSMIGSNDLSFEYNYSYTPAGKVAGKTLEVQSAAHGQAYGALTATYNYDSQGALTSMVYPTEETWAISPTQTFTYTLDAMERPTALSQNYPNNYTWASGATYNAANQPLYDGTATRAYNSLNQMTSIAASGMSMTYNYSSTNNNGQIVSSKDNVSGETVSYQYDALKRLLSASGTGWSEGYVYDGYGNLTQMNPTPSGSAPTLGLTVALDANNVPTNRINATGVTYDNNGNQTLGFGGLSLTYDAANRISAVGGIQTAAYAYDSDNRRIYSRNASGSETIYFYGVDGKKLATYTYAIVTSSGNPEVQLTQQSENVYFLGKLIAAEGNSVQTDRLGSVALNGTARHTYYPYGTEYASTNNNTYDTEKYATYMLDGATGLNYAMNRYYASQWGRFLSPDPYNASVSLGSPQTWNRYAYVSGDPVANRDPSGLSPDAYCWWAEGAEYVGDFETCFDGLSPGPIAGWFLGGGGGGGHSVDKTFKATDPCKKTAAQVLGDVEQNFGAFANTNSVVEFTPLGVPVGALASTATFTGGPISVGDVITAQDTVTPFVNGTTLPTVTKSATLLVTSVGPNGFTLVPQPGAPLTGSIVFNFAQTTAGSISVSIYLVGDPQGGFFAQLFNSLALGSGGGQVENSIWNNALNNVAADCNRPPQ